MNISRYWVGVVSKDHVMKGVTERFVQMNHGKENPLENMKKGDWIIYYSSKEKIGDKKPYQKFTAIGRVEDDYIYQVDTEGDFKPFRRKLKYFPWDEVDIRPLINDLNFIKNKDKWGYPFRFGNFEIFEDDFKFIAREMLNHSTEL